MQRHRPSPVQMLALLGVGAVLVPMGSWAREAGPDALGLGWVDDDAPDGPPTRTVPMAGADALPLPMGGFASVTLPFSLNWAGQRFGSVTVGNDGQLVFEPGSGVLGCPGAGDWVGVAALAQPWAADSVHIRTIGRYPRRTVVVDWSGPVGGGADSGHVQALLSEHGSDIVVLLDDLDFGDPAFDAGMGAALGAQGGPAGGLAVSCGGLALPGAVAFGQVDARPDAPRRSAAGLPAPWLGPAANGFAGQALGRGDVNGDGLDELLIGAPADDRVYVLAGGAASWGGALADADGLIEHAPGGIQLGAALLIADLDADGYGEPIVGAPGDDVARANAGAVYVFPGGGLPGAIDLGAARLSLRGAAGPLDGRTVSSWSGGSAGAAIAVGDVDGDGSLDLATGAPTEGTAAAFAGAVFLTLDAGSLAGVHPLAGAALTYTGDAAGQRLGTALAMGDLDGDTLDELVIGSLGDAPGGGLSGGLALFIAPGGGGLQSAGAAAFAQIAGTTDRGEFSSALALADLDDDGALDVALGAPYASDGLAVSGSVSVFASAGARSGLLFSDEADAVLSADAAGAGMGSALAVDSDGLRRGLWVGAPYAAAGGPTGAGLAARFDDPLGAGAWSLSDADQWVQGAEIGAGLGRALIAGPRRDGVLGHELVAGAPYVSGATAPRVGAVYLALQQAAYADADGDGFVSAESGGPDCDDATAAVHPAGIDIINGLDDDCDGWVDGVVIVRSDADTFDYDVNIELGVAPGLVTGFEDAPLGVALDERYAALGVHFEPGALLTAAASAWGARAVGARAAVHTSGGGDAPLTLRFDTPVDAVGFAALDLREELEIAGTRGGAPVFRGVTARGPGDDLPGGVFLGFTFAQEIDALMLTGVGGDAFGIDDLHIVWAADTDRDGDGVSDADGDCDDADPLVSPELPEILSNGVDDDCDGVIDGGVSLVWPDPVDFGEVSGIDAEIVDFEGLTVGSHPTDDYRRLGVLLDGRLRVLTSVDGAAPRDLRAGRALESTVTVQFLERQPAVGLWVLDAAGPLWVRGWSDGVLLYEEEVDASGEGVDGGVFVGLLFEYGVDTLTLDAADPLDAWGLDDITFSVLGLDDADGDGLTEADGDCDDADASTAPGAVELWYDGVDGDCDGASDFDEDRDGIDSADFGGLDCDDADPSVSPEAAELWYDGVDADCDGGSDFDRDGDGHDDAAFGGADCDDGAATVSPSAFDLWYDGLDADCAGNDDFDADGDGVGAGGGAGGTLVDCDDLDPSIFPGASELWFDGIDQDCGDDSDFDADGDGYDGAVWGGLDCNDLRPEVFPGAPGEECYDGVDQDCNGSNDFDCDADGFTSDAHGGADCADGDAAVFPGAVDAPRDGLDANCDGAPEFDDDGDGVDGIEDGGLDCNDADPAISPFVTERWYDGVDSDCGGDDDFDADGDGFAAVAWGGTDCDDGAASVAPGARERWYDGVDQDCLGGDDFDADRDGFAAAAFGGADCDDNSAARNPAAAERWYDGLDTDCDRRSDFDADRDGGDAVRFGGDDCDDADPTRRGARAEIPLDGVDQDCDGVDDVDVDGDGAWSADDCDDADATVGPAVSDPCGDGVDSNCDGAPEADCDGDGVDGPQVGGPDCDDEAAAAFPGAVERWYDGVDGDCAGGDDFDRDGDGAGAVAWGGADCDDADARVGPHIPTDPCGGQDDDCDGQIDEDCGSADGLGGTSGGGDGSGSADGGSSGTTDGATDGATGGADGGSADSGGTTGGADGGSADSGGTTGGADGGSGGSGGTTGGADGAGVDAAGGDAADAGSEGEHGVPGQDAVGSGGGAALSNDGALAPTPPGAGAPPRACGCMSSSGRGAAAWLGLVVPLMLMRRRRHPQ